MFKEIRRSERTLSDAELLEIMAKAEYGVLSTVGANGYPYGIPINFVYQDNTIYFHCATDGQKLENIWHSNKVSFTVVADVELLPRSFSTKYRSVIAFGLASEVTDTDKKMDILVSIIEKFSKNFAMEGMKYIEASSHKTKVYQVEVEHIAAKGRK
ncbi:MAG: pyridoxamine 5'-phosphate oxidase family protein [Defluviitaleaceae bacterium]|nr:pyridoxamine 5'-phosphate oxidase family protein [Defluviitaleaceae bacterium]